MSQAIEFFSERELACKGSGIIKLDPYFAEELPELRRAWGEPLTVTSVCRSPEHNAAVRGHPRSLHLTDNPGHPTKGCMAADIDWRMYTVEGKKEFARLAWSMGWAVGLHNGFCHIDRRGDIGLARTVFIYGTWSNQFSRTDVI